MKEKKIFGRGVGLLVIILVLAGILLFLCGRNGGFFQKEQGKYSVMYLDVFDTQTQIIGYSTSQREFDAQVQQLKEKLDYYHEQYDIYHNYEGINNIKTINDNAGIAPVKVDEEIINLLKLSLKMYDETNGQINVAMGSVLKVWHEYREEGMQNPEEAALPEMSELQEAAVYGDISKVMIDEEASTVYLADENMSLDVGSIGKGYAVQKIAEYAVEIGMENVLISVGGNICAVGERMDGTMWHVGIQNPDLTSEEAYVETLDLKDMSLVTSGNYQRYYEVAGQRYCHIIDPDTLMPANYFASVSILAPDSGIADALSTSVFNMPLEEGMDLINNMEGVEAMWILEDGTKEYSNGFAQYQPQ